MAREVGCAVGLRVGPTLGAITASVTAFLDNNAGDDDIW